MCFLPVCPAVCVPLLGLPVFPSCVSFLPVFTLEKQREKKDKYTLPDGQTVEFNNNEK